MVNHYIHETAGADFTAKGFRTWAGSLHALQAFRAMGEAANAAEVKKNLLYLREPDAAELRPGAGAEAASLTAEEEVLMKILHQTIVRPF